MRSPLVLVSAVVSLEAASIAGAAGLPCLVELARVPFVSGIQQWSRPVARGDVLYVAELVGGSVPGRTDLVAFDVSDPATPVELARVRLASTGNNQPSAILAADGDDLYATNGLGTFHSFDISDPRVIAPRGTIDLLAGHSRPGAIAVLNDETVLVGRFAGVGLVGSVVALQRDVLRSGDPSASFVGAFEVPRGNGVVGAVSRDESVFVSSFDAAGNDSLVEIDYANVGQPTLGQTLEVFVASGLAISERGELLFANGSALAICPDPSSLASNTTVSFGAQLPLGFAVRDGLVFRGTTLIGAGVSVTDVSDVNQPIVVDDGSQDPVVGINLLARNGILYSIGGVGLVVASYADCVPIDPCNAADLAPSVGVLDLADIDAFILAFTAGDPLADIASNFGVLDLADIDAFIAGFLAGCP